MLEFKWRWCVASKNVLYPLIASRPVDYICISIGHYCTRNALFNSFHLAITTEIRDRQIISIYRYRYFFKRFFRFFSENRYLSAIFFGRFFSRYIFYHFCRLYLGNPQCFPMLKWRYFPKYRYISAIFFWPIYIGKNRYFSSDFIDLIPICNEIWVSLNCVALLCRRARTINIQQRLLVTAAGFGAESAF
jgi:hypothetical protein